MTKSNFTLYLEELSDLIQKNTAVNPNKKQWKENLLAKRAEFPSYLEQTQMDEKRKLLEYAIALDWVKEVKLLTKLGTHLNGVIKNKGALNTKNQRKKIAFHESYLHSVIKESHLNESDYNWEWTPLTLALHLGHLKIAYHLLEKGVDSIEPLVFAKAPYAFKQKEIEPPLFFLMGIDYKKSNDSSLILQKKIFNLFMKKNNDIRQNANNRDLYVLNTLFWNGDFEKIQWLKPHLNVPHFPNKLVSKIFTYYLQNREILGHHKDQFQKILQLFFEIDLKFRPEDVHTLKEIKDLEFESLYDKQRLEKNLEKSNLGQIKNKIRL